MAYVYKHIRLDNLAVFYIGISSGGYGRWKSSSNRTVYWQNIVSKHGFKAVKIIDNISWEQACQLEIMLISKYGRIDKEDGNLVNFKDGGEGSPDYSRITDTKVSMYSEDGSFIMTFNNLKEADKYLKVSRGCVRKSINYGGTCKGFIFKRGKESIISLKSVLSIHGYNKKTVLLFDKHYNFIRKFKSIKEADKFHGSRGRVSRICNGLQENTGDYIYEFE